MKNIIKGNEPQSLTEYRALNPSDFEGYPGKDQLRISLCSEQRGLCCYCMGRIRPMIGSMKIEHWQPQDRYEKQRLVYANLLGACMGGKGYRLKDQHCDTYKANRDLCRNPANPGDNVEAFIRYGFDGSVTSSDELLNEHLNTVLHLNLPILKANRKAVLTSFKKFLGLRHRKIKRDRWQQLLDEWSGKTAAGDLEPYAGVVAYWIRKHLA